jgi:activator of HSP90 ATPase
MTATRQIRHVVRFDAEPRAIYQALMNSKKHAAFTGAPAKIDAKVGGRFAAWGPHLRGVTVDLIKNKRIVQAWRAANWPAGHFSIATFELKRAKGGAVLVFTQTGIPAKNASSINAGWKTHYWQPLKTAFAKRKKR